MSQRNPTQRRLVGGLLSLILLAAGTEQAAGLALAPGDTAPELRGDTFRGERLLIDYSASKLTLVNYWATWCVPCLEEMPALDHLAQIHGADRVQVVGVLHDSVDDETALEFLEPMGLSYPLLRPRDYTADRWGGIASLPTTFLIDSEGEVLRRYVGATAEQVKGLAYDVSAALEDRPLGPFVYPTAEGAVTNEDRLRLKRDAEAKAEADRGGS
ncbi:MAG: TlpA family protein disulfide reductase [bacterium]|nr:TlpA family protein disulfide reductase [bacterium]